MKNDKAKRILNVILTPLMSAVVVSVIFFVARGFPLGGIPKAEEVRWVEITDNTLGITDRRFEGEEDIVNAVNCVHLLSTQLGRAGEEEPFIQVAFFRKDGGVTTVGVGESTIYIDDRAYRRKAGKEDSFFVKCLEGLFFLEEAVRGQTVAGLGPEGDDMDRSLS